MPRKSLSTYVYAELTDEEWARVDAVRGDMPRRNWVRAAFFRQLELDERTGLVAGMTPEQNPFDGDMPYGLPLPSPYDPKLPNQHTRPGYKNKLKKSDASTELRHIQVIHMASEGRTHQEIADITGYNIKTVSYIIRHDLNKYKMASVQEYRELTLRKLLELLQMQEKTIKEPGYLTTVTGSVATGPDGQPLIDKGERTRAVTEARKIVESIRREVGTDAPTQRHVTLEEANLNNTLKSLMAALAVQGKVPAAALEDAIDAEVIEDDDSAPPEPDEALPAGD